MKICSTCKVLKSFDSFHKDKRNNSGLKSSCKSCVKIYKKQYDLENAENIKIYDKQYYLENIDSKRAYYKRYYIENIDMIKEQKKRYRLENIDKFKQYRLDHAENKKIYNKQYHLENVDSKRAYYKQYRLNNADEMRNNNAKRRAQKLNNGTYKISKKELVRLYNSPCFYCGSGENVEADHVVPISRGGQHSIGNLVPACRACNRSKHNKLLIEWKK